MDSSNPLTIKHIIIKFLSSFLLGLTILTLLSFALPPTSAGEMIKEIDVILDPSFDSSYGANAGINAIAIQSDGKILIGGNFTTYGEITRQYIARLNTDGGLDETFDSSSGADFVLTAIALQDDEKILIGGYFTAYDGVTRQYIARLNSDGSLDETFDSSSGTNDFVSAIAIQSDGKILIGGKFITYDGVTRERIARLNSDGSLDETFDSSSGVGTAYTFVSTIVIQSDGKILIGGNFTTYNGVTRQRIARLNSNGSLDETFDSSNGAGSTYSSVNAIAIQGDGKILIGGTFTTYAGVTRKHIARLNNDGSLDETFDSSSGVNRINEDVRTIVIQNDGKILVGGKFTSYAEVNRQYIVSVNSDGTLDTSFDSSSGVVSGINTYIKTIAIQDDGRILIGGNFTTYDTTPSLHIARIYPEPEKYDITYYLNDGSNNGGNPTTYNVFTPTITLLDPTKTGYTFGGWFSEAEFTNEVTEITLGSAGDISLYAKWTINNYTVSFNGNSNTSGSVPLTITQNYNTQVIVPGNTGSLTKAGYTFNGWNTLANGSGTTYVAGNTFNMPTTDSTLYAQWAVNNYNITYNLDGGKNNSNNPTIYKITTPTITLLNPTRTGHTFEGWYSEMGFINKITQITSGSAGDISLYAKWTINNYTVSFNGNSNTSGSVPLTITQNYNTQVIVPGNTGSLTKAGYTFNGWNTLANGSGTTYVAGNTFNMPTTDSTLYAQWAVTPITIVPQRVIPLTTALQEPEETKEEKEIAIPKKITKEEIIQVKTILSEVKGEGNNLNKEEGVTVAVGENKINTKEKKTIHIYKDSEIDISIPTNTLIGGESKIDNVYAVLGENVIKLTLDTISDKYIGKLTSENLNGKQNIYILTIFEDESSRKSVLGISIDPYGYIYTINKDGNQVRIKDATVTLYKIVDGRKTLHISSGQDNPQMTDVEGQYSFLVEPGTYVLIVKADNYKDYDSGEFEVEKTIIEMNIELEEKMDIRDYLIYGLIALISIPTVVMILRKKE